MIPLPVHLKLWSWKPNWLWTSPKAAFWTAYADNLVFKEHSKSKSVQQNQSAQSGHRANLDSCGRVAYPPGPARLAGSRVHGERLGRQAYFEGDGDERHLPA